jgi:uncharacterized protein
MEINVSQQLKASIGTIREYEIDEPIDILEKGSLRNIKGLVTLTRTNRGILVKGTLKTKVPNECSRCLNTFDCPLEVSVEEEFFPIIDVNSGTALEVLDEPEYFRIDEHHILDLTEAIRQNALLVIPMKPLCRPDCPGFCPECGQDLTKGTCECETEVIDPRWSKLAELAKKNKTKNRKNETE